MDALQILLICLLFDAFGMKIPVPISTLSSHYLFLLNMICATSSFSFTNVNSEGMFNIAMQ